MRKVFDFDAVEIDKILGRRKVLITDEMIRGRASSIDSSLPHELADTPRSAHIALPSIFDSESLNMLDQHYGQRFSGMHTTQVWELERPVTGGSEVQIEVSIVDKFSNLDQDFIVTATTIMDAAGDTLYRGRHTSLITRAAGTSGVCK